MRAKTLVLDSKVVGETADGVAFHVQLTNRGDEAFRNIDVAARYPSKAYGRGAGGSWAFIRPGQAKEGSDVSYALRRVSGAPLTCMWFLDAEGHEWYHEFDSYHLQGDAGYKERPAHSYWASRLGDL